MWKYPLKRVNSRLDVPARLWSWVRRSRPKTKRRERRAHFGELVQLDGSFHDWFEGRGERSGRRSCVMNMVDDAMGTTLLRFGEQETIRAAVDVLRAWIQAYGVPRALYTDWKNVYKRPPTAAEEAAGEAGHTHFGRMGAKLEIEIIAAGTPQAKGRVERSNGTQPGSFDQEDALAGHFGGCGGERLRGGALPSGFQRALRRGTGQPGRLSPAAEPRCAARGCVLFRAHAEGWKRFRGAVWEARTATRSCGPWPSSHRFEGDR
jgi:hypothetical protein